MSGHEITIGDASVTFEQVEVELDYNDILLNIEDTISERITDQIGDEAWDAVSIQVDDCVGEHLEDLEEAVWQAISRLDSAETDDNVWAAAAKEYLLSMATDVRAMVREELFNLGRLGQLRLTVSRPESGAEIAVAPGD